MLKNKILLSLSALLFTITLSAQENSDVYWISFTDKEHNTFSLQEPLEFLSQKALDRRENQNIELNETDLPVSDFYLDSLNSLGITVRYTSKWFNGAAIQSLDTELLDTIINFGFIQDKIQIREEIPPTTILKNTSSDNIYDYGLGENQISMINGHILHNQGYSGQGMLIAVLDSGFPDVPSLSCFEEMNNEGRILATRNIVSGIDDVYGYHTHGRAVLSIIGGKDPANLIGTAPDADYILIRTEDADSEQLIEEYNWIAGAEYADSLGVDIFSVSLGYRNYDNPAWNYELSEYNGRTAPISIAATMASQKGILVIVAAGNDGSGENPTIGAPADADSVLTIGATNSEGLYASFSSIGYTADGRVKPDIVAQGEATFYQGSDGGIGSGNGTSFSTPVVAGLAACLWQANPNMSNMEILRAIQESASMYDSPNEHMGYGLPDFAQANLALRNINYTALDTENLITVYPNPATDLLNIEFYSVDTQHLDINIYNAQGRVMYQTGTEIRRNTYLTWTIPEINNYAEGLYVLQIIGENGTHSKSFIKE